MNYAENRIHTGHPDYETQFWNCMKGAPYAEDRLEKGRSSATGTYNLPEIHSLLSWSSSPFWSPVATLPGSIRGSRKLDPRNPRNILKRPSRDVLCRTFKRARFSRLTIPVNFVRTIRTYS
jgi:hypothetical protein